MRFSAHFFLLTAALLIWPLAPAPHAGDGTAPGDPRRDWILPVLPSVVSISTVKFVDDQPGKVPPRRIDGFGSGFVVDPGGTIATNRHVIEGTTEIRVALPDGTVLPANPVYVGAQIDLALLKVEAGRPLPALTFANSDLVQVGDPVAAIGNPLMLGGSASGGIVSGLNRDIMSSVYDDFIQTDAAINHGNSGGPLINTQGQVIGMNTAIYSPTATSGSIGIGFAAPANDVAFVIDQMRHYGRVRAGWIGLNAQTVTPEIAQAVAAPETRGAIVTGLSSKSPAAEAGLQEGDVILKLGDREPADSRAVARIVVETTPGTSLPVTVWRGGKSLTVPVAVAEWHDHPMREVGGKHDDVVAVKADTKDYGLRFTSLTEDTRRRLRLDRGQKGAVVSEVGLNSPAADGGFRNGDLVLRVQMQAVGGPEDAMRHLTDSLHDRRPVIIVLIQRADGLRWLPLAASFRQG